MRYVLGTMGAWLAGAVFLRATVIPAQVCPPIDATAANASALASAQWIADAQRLDGSYVYEYDRQLDREIPGYNVVRHAGVTMSLYQLAVEGEPGYLPIADRGLDFMEANMFRRDGWAAFQDPADGGVALGASALMLAGLGQRRIATGDHAKDDLMKEVGRYLLVMQRPDGSFLANWLLSTGAPDPHVTSKYATGEAFWALAMMHEAFPGEGWDRPTWLVADYLATSRDAVENFKFPPWADQWAAYGFAEMAGWGLREEHISYIDSLADRFGFLVRTESQRTNSSWSKTLHGRQARAAGMGTWVEALGSLWRLAGSDPRLAHLQPKIAERATCGAGMLAHRQVSSPQPILDGAWFTNDVTRMDDQQHALSALIRSVPILPGGKE